MASNWKNSKPHLELLSKFIRFNSLDKLLSNEYYSSSWKEFLEESPKKAFERFINEGYLNKSNLNDMLDYSFKVTELKTLCKSKGLSTSGKKSDLIDRLIKTDKKGMMSEVKSIKIYSCSDSGLNLAQDYLDMRLEEKRIAEEKVYESLKKKDFKSASQIMIDYERNQVFPRGLGINWNSIGIENYVSGLRELFENTPKILRNIPDEKLKILRIEAGFSFLWGGRTTNYFKNYDKFSERFDNDVSLRMMSFYATHKNTLANYCANSDVVVGVKILPAQDACDECKKLAEKLYRLSEEIPELPHADCTNIMGCRCCYLPQTILCSS